MSRKSIILTVLFSSVGLLFTGCGYGTVQTTAGGETSTSAYMGRTLTGAESADIAEVYKASEAAVEQLGFKTVEKNQDSMSAKIVARDSQDKKVVITLKATPQKTTDIDVRYGTVGNKDKSALIYEKIQENLKNPKK